MAWFAEMCVAPAEPLCYGAAELAFVFYEFHSVGLTVFYAAANADRCALATHQLLFFEILVIILSRLAVFHTTKVWLIALIALIVR